VLDADVVDLNNVVMRELGRGERFARETRDKLRIARELGREHFERDVAVK
jgi:hypothetical protein